MAGCDKKASGRKGPQQSSSLPVYLALSREVLTAHSFRSVPCRRGAGGQQAAEVLVATWYYTVIADPVPYKRPGLTTPVGLKYSFASTGLELLYCTSNTTHPHSTPEAGIIPERQNAHKKKSGNTSKAHSRLIGYIQTNGQLRQRHAMVKEMSAGLGNIRGWFDGYIIVPEQSAGTSTIHHLRSNVYYRGGTYSSNENRTWRAKIKHLWGDTSFLGPSWFLITAIMTGDHIYKISK